MNQCPICNEPLGHSIFCSKGERESKYRELLKEAVIERDALKEQLSDRNIKFNWLYSKWEKVADKYLQATAELQAERDKHRWIPVDERLPEREELVNVSNGSYYPDQAFLSEYGGWRVGGEDRSVRTDFYTHWKSLPDAPGKDN